MTAQTNGQDLESIPDFLDRTKGMTDEQIRALSARARRNAGKPRGRKFEQPAAFRAELAETDLANIKALKKAGADKVSAIRQVGAKLRSETATKSKTPRAKVAAVVVQPATDNQETDMSTKKAAIKTKSAIKPTTARTRREPGSKPARTAARTPVKPNLKATTTGSGDHKPRADYDAIFKMLQKGATHKEVCEFTGWPRGLNRMATIAERNDCKLEQLDGGIYKAVPKK